MDQVLHICNHTNMLQCSVPVNWLTNSLPEPHTMYSRTYYLNPISMYSRTHYLNPIFMCNRTAIIRTLAIWIGLALLINL